MRISDWSSDVCSSDLISDRVLPGTGMCNSHVECRALTYRSERTQDLTEPGIENKTRTYFVIRPRRFQARCRQRQEKGRICSTYWLHSLSRQIGRASVRERVFTYV